MWRRATPAVAHNSMRCGNREPAGAIAATTSLEGMRNPFFQETWLPILPRPPLLRSPTCFTDGQREIELSDRKLIAKVGHCHADQTNSDREGIDLSHQRDTGLEQ
jgi:hypothetical protein